MTSEFSEFEERLRRIIRKTGQSRYERNAPHKDTIKELVHLKAELIESIGNREAPPLYDMLSLIDECLLRFRASREWLEKKIALLGKTSNKDRKRMALLTQQIADFDELPFPEVIETDLFEYLHQIDWSNPLSQCSQVLVAKWLSENLWSPAICDAADAYFRNHRLDSDYDIYKHLLNRKSK